jgi:membrane protease YdiL (CAAX protease family)
MEQVFTNSNVIGPVVYLLLVPGVFEVFFYYAFMRTIFEKAFGIIPAIILTAIMYSFHHIGFQPEFGKLIFVGILMASIFRMGGNFLIIFPLF